MTPDEKLKAFKSVTRNYQKYLEHIKDIDDKLEEINTRMENVHSINFEKETSVPSYKERPMIEIIEIKTGFENEKQHYLDLIHWIHEVIDSFESPAIKALIWMTFVQRKSLSSIADEYYISKDNLYKIRRKQLSKVLNDNMMNRLDEIQNNLNTYKNLP